MTGNRVKATLVALLAATTAACSGADAEPPEPPAPTTSATPSSTSPPPTAEEQAAAAALDVFEQDFQLAEEALQAPASRDWEPEIRLTSIDPTATQALDGLQSLEELGARQVGTSSVTPEVTAVDLSATPQPTVSIRACYDNTNSEIVFVDTGRSIVPPGAPPEPQRYVLLVTVVQLVDEPGSPWRVQTQEPQRETAC